MPDDQIPPKPGTGPKTSEAKAISQAISENNDIITSEVSVKPDRTTGPDLQATQRQAKVPPGALGLFPRDSQDPILYRGPQKMVLGRAQLPDMGPSIDLTPYDALDLGVSRRHAAIALSGNQYLIEDLGSMNGTWLHDTRLPLYVQRQLQSGDIFRLGQLEITVYFHPPSMPSTAQSPAVKVDAQKKSAELSSDAIIALFVGAEELVFDPDGAIISHDAKLTTSILAAHLVPYIQALEQFQKLIDEMQGKPRHSLVILQIRATPRISVTLSGAVEAVKLARTVIAHWRQQHKHDIARLVTVKTTSSTPSLTKEQSMAIEVSEAELTAEILARVGDKLPTPELSGYAKQLIEPVKAIISSPLSLEAEDEVKKSG